MPSCPSLSFNFYLVWKKILRTKIFFLFFFVFVLFLGFLSQLADFHEAQRFFLILFPYLFLLLGQDMFKEEIDSGSLENILFLRVNFRRYLLEKNLTLFIIGAAFSSLLFLPFLVSSIGQKNFTPTILSSFFLGLVVGLYYLSLAGWLSFRWRSGANVLIIIIGQVFLFLAFLVSLTASSFSRDLFELIFSAQPKNQWETLFLFIFVALWPNVLAARNYSAWGLRLEIFLLILLFLGLQIRKLNRLELKKG